MDGEDGVLPVVLAGQDDGQLEVVELLPQALEARLDLRLEALVALLQGHLPEGPEVAELARRAPPPARRAARGRCARGSAPGRAGRRPRTRRSPSRASMAAMRASFEARSKMPPEIVEPPLEVRELAPKLAEHGASPAGPRRGRPRARRRTAPRRRTRRRRRSACRRSPRARSGTSARSVPRAPERQGGLDRARRQHERRHAGVGGAHDGDAVLDRAERHHREMLQRAARVAEPRVVGDVGHEARALRDEPPEEVGEDDLVADDRAERRALQREDRRLPARREVPDLGGDRLHEKEEPLQGHVLPERHQVHLIIAGAHACRLHEERAVEVADPAPLGLRVGRADEERHPHRRRQIGQPAHRAGLEAEVRGHRGLRPDDQPAARRGCPRQLAVDPEGLRLESGVPLDGLRDVPLHHGDGRVGASSRSELGAADQERAADGRRRERVRRPRPPAIAARPQSRRARC